MFPTEVQDNNFDNAKEMYLNGTIKQMADSGSKISHFWSRKFTEKQGEEVRMSHLVMY